MGKSGNAKTLVIFIFLVSVVLVVALQTAKNTISDLPSDSVITEIRAFAPSDIANRVWRLKNVFVHGQKTELLYSRYGISPPVIFFTGSEVLGWDGCNWFRGTLQTSFEDQLEMAHRVMSTAKDCDAIVTSVETATNKVITTTITDLDETASGVIFFEKFGKTTRYGIMDSELWVYADKEPLLIFEPTNIVTYTVPLPEFPK
jgi:hypothetical protein